jgi:hypothetical protein
MLFQAVMKFLSRHVEIKISLKRGKVYSGQKRRLLKLTINDISDPANTETLMAHLLGRWNKREANLPPPAVTPELFYTKKVGRRFINSVL